MVQKELYATDQWVIQKKDAILLESKTKVKSYSCMLKQRRFVVVAVVD